MPRTLETLARYDDGNLPRRSWTPVNEVPPRRISAGFRRGARLASGPGIRAGLPNSVCVFGNELLSNMWFASPTTRQRPTAT